jgi:hypothetical protein
VVDPDGPLIPTTEVEKETDKDPRAGRPSNNLHDAETVVPPRLFTTRFL